MGLKICMLGSGSKGNCAIVRGNATSVLIDAGLSIARIEKCMRLFCVAPQTLSVLVTHTHIDHVGALAKLVEKYGIQVFAYRKSVDELVRKYKVPLTNITAIDGDFFVGEFTVSPFEVSHDVPCVGYCVSYGGKKLAYATDIGKMSEKVLRNLRDADLVVLESNHDEDMLLSNEKYPPYLKQRILSDKGHLSNAVAGQTAVDLVKNGVKQIILAHLSEENNLPELAFSTVRDCLVKSGVRSEDVRVEVALQEKMSGLYEIV